MEHLIALVEKGKPFFDAVARNKYLKAIRDGFISVMPIIIFSSLFLLIADIPVLWGYEWPKEINDFLMKPYNYSMGIVGLLVAATTAKHFTDALNRTMPKTNQINSVSTMLAAVVGFAILASGDVVQQLADGSSLTGLDTSYLGSKGLLTAFLTAFVVGGIYKYLISHNVTLKMPEQVPPNISQTFKDIIPFAATTIAFWLFDHFFRLTCGFCFAEGIIRVFQPLFSAADTYPGLAVVYGAIGLFWFVGVHGPSIVEPAIGAIAFYNVANNLTLAQSGQHAASVITPGTQYFVVTMGGTGATLMITLMIAFLARSKQLKAIGRASAVPVLFGVNEPILFGAPFVLNPVFFIPFVLAPVFNVWIFKIFVDVLGMNSFTYVLPWVTPAPLGICLGCAMQPLAVIYVIVALAADFVVYYPFFRVYDRQLIEQETLGENSQDAETGDMGESGTRGVEATTASTGEQSAAEESIRNTVSTETPLQPEAAPAPSPVTSTEHDASPKGDSVHSTTLDGKRVLVLCAGGGTSGLLANALAKAAREHSVGLEAAAGAYGAHLDIMGDFDLVILAPQVASYLPDLEKDAARMGVATAACGGKEYIELTRDGEKSLRFVADALNKGGE
jgi:PTS system lactose-specific IIC component